jgi:MFS family permease
MMRRRAAVPLALGALVLASLLLRTQNLGVNFWIDEALSVGIADRPLTDIPDALRLDGSPPLFYMLLHGWMRLLGDRSEETTHLLSLILATATIPVAWAFMRTLFGERAGWCAAVLAASNPFITHYAQETRMYALVILLGTIASATFVGAFLQQRGPRWNAGFAIALILLLYTHNWALFFGAAAGSIWLLLVRDRRGVYTFAAVAVAYLPWVPALLFQARHTGAPWARAPDFEQLYDVPRILLGPTELGILVAVAVFAAVALRDHEQRNRIATLVGLFALTVMIAWLASQASPAWANRYLAVALPPLLLGAAALAAYAGRAGVVVVAAVALFSYGDKGPSTKSNVANVAAAIAPTLRSGDLVVSTQPEQAPALAYYLEDVEGLRWATLFGPLTDLGVTDWRDGVERLEASSPEEDLAPLLDATPVGARVALVEPEIFSIQRWSAPWTRLVRVRSNQWRAWMLGDRRFRVVAVRPEDFVPPAPNPVRATVFLKVGIG